MGTPAPSQGDAAAAIAAASAKYQVPVQILAGVYGHESSFGTAYVNANEPTYGFFGLTSPGLWKPSFTIQQDADAAAQTLLANFKKTGNWNSAVLAYSGNSYNADSATSMANSNSGLMKAIGTAALSLTGKTPPGITGSSSNPGQAVSNAAGAVSSAVSSASSIADLVTSGSFWLRVLEGVAGVVLLILGLRALSGGDGNPVTVTTNAAKKAGKTVGGAAAVAAV
jgi:hypothetical protein